MKIMMIKWIMGHEGKKEGFLWNAAGGAVSSGQSAILLVFISHRLGITVAGIVTIAYAVANLFATMTRYGVRNYQVTDVNRVFSFGDYFYSRIFSALLTGMVCAVYMAWCAAANGDPVSKLVILGEVTVLKLIDAVEDVYLGCYQQSGYFCAGAKIMAVRLIVSTGLICILVCAGADIYLSLFCGICISLGLDIYLIHGTFRMTHAKIGNIDKGHVRKLMGKCLPLCVGTTLSMYIGNVPKYMIDIYMDENVQAIFGYIMMPVFVVMLLNTFLYQPVIKELGDIWKERNYGLFRKKILWQCMIVCGMTVLVIAGGMAVGLPVLSVIYNADLTAYRMEFLVLLLGGGFYALAYYLNVPITTIRKQKYIAIGYVAAAVGSLLTGRFFVVKYGMMGAAVLYLGINILLAVIYSAVLLFGIRNSLRGECS